MMDRMPIRRQPMAVTLLALLLAVPAAQAMPGGGRFAGEGPRQGEVQREPSEAREPRPFFPPRQEPAEAPRPQRLSPEERRQLRRDVHEAGRDLYPPRRF